MMFCFPFVDGESVEDLVRLVTDQIRSSDWLVHNTAARWQEENPELAAEFIRLAASDTSGLDAI